MTAVGSEQIDETHTLTDLVMTHAIGDKVTLTVQRSGKELRIDVTLATRPNQA